MPYYVSKNGNTNYEVGHFIEMLCSGVPEAFDMISSPDIEYIDPYFKNLITQKEFISETLIKNMFEESLKLKKVFELGRSVRVQNIDEDTIISQIDYDKEAASDCLMLLRTILDIYRTSEYIVPRAEVRTLNGILEGVFSRDSISLELENAYKEIEKKKKNKTFRDSVNFSYANEVLLKLRGLIE